MVRNALLERIFREKRFLYNRVLIVQTEYRNVPFRARDHNVPELSLEIFESKAFRNGEQHLVHALFRIRNSNEMDSVTSPLPKKSSVLAYRVHVRSSFVSTLS